MSLSDILAKYSKTFNYFGETNITFESIPSLKRKLLNYALSLIAFAVNISILAINIFYEIKWIDIHSQVDISIQIIFFTSIILTRLTVFIQIYCSRGAFKRFFIQFKHFEKITNSKFELKSAAFEMIYLQKVAAIIFCWLLSIFVSLLIVRGGALNVISKILFLFMILLSRLCICHILFYLGFMRVCYELFQNYVKGLRMAKPTNIKSELLSMKLIHFKLGELTKTFNVLFGWILSSIFLQQFIDIVFRMYWIYRYSNRNKDIGTIFRK